MKFYNMPAEVTTCCGNRNALLGVSCPWLYMKWKENRGNYSALKILLQPKKRIKYFIFIYFLWCLIPKIIFGYTVTMPIWLIIRTKDRNTGKKPWDEIVRDWREATGKSRNTKHWGLPPEVRKKEGFFPVDFRGNKTLLIS